MKINFSKCCTASPKTPHRVFQNRNYSTIKLSVRKARTVALFFPVAGFKSTSPAAAAAAAQLETEAEPGTASTPQVRPACWASLGARWPHCQQAGPGLIKDVEPNWSCQHLLPLHLGGWRQSSAQYAHKRSDLEERRVLRDQTLHMKKVNGMNGDQRNPECFKRHFNNVWHQMDRTLSDYKYCCCVTVNLSSLLPFVHILCLRCGLTIRLFSPRYSVAVYWAAIKSVGVV